MSQPIIKRDRVQLHASPQPASAKSVSLLGGAGEGAPHGQKAVRLLEEGGRVRAIEFTCACGEITAVELLYPGDSPSR